MYLFVCFPRSSDGKCLCVNVLVGELKGSQFFCGGSCFERWRWWWCGDGDGGGGTGDGVRICFTERWIGWIEGVER